MRINTDIFGRGAIFDFESSSLFTPSGLNLYYSGQLTSNKRDVRPAHTTTISHSCCLLNAQDVDPDQTPVCGV